MNCVDYFHGGEKPYLISGADDRAVKIWDYQVIVWLQFTLVPSKLQNDSGFSKQIHPPIK